jgi:hypothetical protein
MWQRVGFMVLSVLAVSAADAAAGQSKKSHACDGCPGIFRAFDDGDGKVRSDRIDNSLDASNPMFDEDLGKNGQACYDCHQPRQGFTLTWSRS